MIKQLITDIAYDKIDLAQALTRAKLIGGKVKNESFSSWINKELIGYDNNDITLPNYRKLLFINKLIITDGWNTRDISLSLLEVEMSDDTREALSTFPVKLSIKEIIEHANNFERSQKLEIPLRLNPMNLSTSFLGSLFNSVSSLQLAIQYLSL